MRTSCIVLVGSAIVLSATFAWAQRGPGRGGGLFLLGQESVQGELKLSAEQIKHVDEQLAKGRESLSGLRDLGRQQRQAKLQEVEQANLAALGAVLDQDQLKRFKQIALQNRGGQALADSVVATALGLDAEQKERVGAIQAEARQEMRSLFQDAAGADRQQRRKKLQEARAASNEKLMGVLTPEQQTKWKEITGKPFTGQIRRGFRGNRGDAGGERNRRRNRDAAGAPTRGEGARAAGR